jgi:hypothetical protein
MLDRRQQFTTLASLLVMCFCPAPPPSPAGPELPLEDFNRYALLLDIDGNAWSDRYRLYAHMNTPVLKQASNLTGFFEHVMAPGAVLEQYAPDLSDLPVRARQLLLEMQQQPGRVLRMAGEGSSRPCLLSKVVS